MNDWFLAYQLNVYFGAMSRDLWVRDWTTASGLTRHKTRSPHPLPCLGVPSLAPDSSPSTNAAGAPSKPPTPSPGAGWPPPPYRGSGRRCSPALGGMGHSGAVTFSAELSQPFPMTLCSLGALSILTLLLHPGAGCSSDSSCDSLTGPAWAATPPKPRRC